MKPWEHGAIIPIDPISVGNAIRLCTDEIERLNKTLDDHLNSEAAETRRADRERDRARKAEDEVRQLRLSHLETEKEIERLRRLISVSGVDKLLDQIQHMEVAIANSGFMQFAYKQEQEIERLREENALLTRGRQPATPAALLAEEVRQLRLSHLETEKEIERLRELLRETHLALSFMPDPTRKLLDLRYRIREALGGSND